VIMRVPGTRITFDYHTQYAVGDECACVGSLTITSQRELRVGVFVYRVNDVASRPLRTWGTEGRVPGARSCRRR
jgi:hypothetical protein